MATAAGRIRPTSTPRRSVPPPRVLVDAFNAYRAHQLTDNAAALAYYAMMSLFPAALMAVSLLGLFGQARIATDFANYIVQHGADQATADTVRNVLAHLVQKSSGAAGLAFVIATLLALNGASGAYGAAGRAINKIYAVDEDRSFVHRKATDLAMTLVVILLFLVVLVALFLGGGIAHDLFGKIGLGSAAASVWNWVRWPIALCAALMAYAVVYAYAPDVEPRRLRWITPGAVGGVTIWLVGSLLFSLYIRNFSSYGAAYGSAGGMIVLLLWLFLTSNAFLFGAELNATLEREETAAAAEELGPAAMSTARHDPDT
jgi:membrane protein